MGFTAHGPQIDVVSGAQIDCAGWQLEMAMVQNQWYHFGIGAPPILVYLSGDWDVHLGVPGCDSWPGQKKPSRFMAREAKHALTIRLWQL